MVGWADGTCVSCDLLVVVCVSVPLSYTLRDNIYAHVYRGSSKLCVANLKLYRLYRYPEDKHVLGAKHMSKYGDY